MEQVLLNAAQRVTVNWMPATIIHYQIKNPSRSTSMLQSGGMSTQTLAERLDTLRLEKRESKAPSNGKYTASSSDRDSATMDSVKPFHHLNFFGKPVYHKCATPPATSLAILLSQKQGIMDFDRCIRKATLVWDALQFLEPVAYWGPHDTLEKLRGTALKEAVTGQCGKLYTGNGTWLEDRWEESEDEPLNYNETAKTDVLFNGQRSYNLAPSDQDFLDELHGSGRQADGVKSFMNRRENLLARPCSSLREVTCAADSD